MRLALLGDIHGNSTALSAVLEHLAGKSIDKIYHTGDVVGYCTEFTGVIETLITESVAGVIGNHEQMLLGEFSDERASPSAVSAICWSKERLDGDSRMFLWQLPTRIIENRLAIFHATPTSTVRVIKYENGADKAFEDLKEWPDHWLAVHGHTHVQRVFSHSHGRTERVNFDTETVVRMDPDRSYLACPGSVGISRDEDKRAAYAIFDTLGTLEFYRVSYDWRLTRSMNRQAGLSTALFRSRSGAVKDWIYQMSGGRIDVLW